MDVICTYKLKTTNKFNLLYVSMFPCFFHVSISGVCITLAVVKRTFKEINDKQSSAVLLFLGQSFSSGAEFTVNIYGWG